MQEIEGDLFEQKWASAICITTNGFIKKNGCAVMGRGCAKEARERFPGIDLKLGTTISIKGNHVNHLLTITTHLIDESSGWGAQDIYSFPVKKYWWDQADLTLIEQSAKELVDITNKKGYTSVVIPRPGCNNGKRDWETEVKPILNRLLDDRFYIVNYAKENK